MLTIDDDIGNSRKCGVESPFVLDLLQLSDTLSSDEKDCNSLDCSESIHS